MFIQVSEPGGAGGNPLIGCINAPPFLYSLPHHFVWFCLGPHLVALRLILTLSSRIIPGRLDHIVCLGQTQVSPCKANALPNVYFFGPILHHFLTNTEVVQINLRLCPDTYSHQGKCVANVS